MNNSISLISLPQCTLVLGHYWPLKTHCLVYQQFILYIFPTKQMRKHVYYKWAYDSSCSPSPAWNIPTLISNCYLKCVKRFISISFSFNLKIPETTQERPPRVHWTAWGFALTGSEPVGHGDVPGRHHQHHGARHLHTEGLHHTHIPSKHTMAKTHTFRMCKLYNSTGTTQNMRISWKYC